MSDVGSYSIADEVGGDGLLRPAQCVPGVDGALAQPADPTLALLRTAYMGVNLETIDSNVGAFFAVLLLSMLSASCMATVDRSPKSFLVFKQRL